MLLLLSILKLVMEIALLSLAGQGVLYILAGERRDGGWVPLMARPSVVDAAGA